MGRVRVGRIMLVAGLVEVMGLLAAAAVTFLAGRALGNLVWLVPPIAAVAAGMARAGVEAVGSRRREADERQWRPEPQPGWPPGPQPRWPGPPPRRPGVPVFVAVLAVVLVLGVGGYAAAIGIRAGVGWITGNEPQVGRERLVSSPAPSGRSGRVAVTVTSVVNTRHFTRVALAVDNNEKQAATLTLFHNCVVTAGGVTLEAEPFKSGWTEDVPPGSTQHGHVTFPGHLPGGDVSAQLSFVHVFVFGRFGANDTLVIKPIRLRGP